MTDELRIELYGLVSPSRHLYGPDSQGGEACRPTVPKATKFEFVINLQTAEALGLDTGATARHRRRGGLTAYPRDAETGQGAAWHHRREIRLDMPHCCRRGSETAGARALVAG
jgi:hypothetical protein